MTETDSGKGRSAIIAILIVIVLTSFAAAAIWRVREAGEENGPEAAASEGDPPAAAGGTFATDVSIPVAVDTVRQGTLRLDVSATGQTEAARRARVVARVAGQIVALPVDESARVDAGRILVRLDPSEYALAVEEAEAALEEAKAGYREMTLFDERIEDPAVREDRAAAARAKSGLPSAEIALRKARLDLANTSIPAPFGGQVADLQVTRGEYVTAGQELLTMVALNPIHAEVRVPESELRWLAEGSGATVHLPAFPEVEYRGTVASINPVVDPESRTGRVSVVIANSHGTILPGMFARVVLEGRGLADRVTVPRDALIERDDRNLVFVFEPIEDEPEGEGLAKWVYVTPGAGNAERVEILENDETDLPEPGSLVVTDGNYTLVHDARVRIAPPETESSP